MPVSSGAPNGVTVPSSADLRKLFPLTIPVWPVDESGYCTCYLGAGCRRPGKHADEQAPEDSPAYAVVTGQAGGVFVVDQDRKPNTPDGVAQFLALAQGDTPPTFETETPTTGRHTFYLWPGFHVGNNKPDSAIDIRGDGELVYVIGPGSPGYIKTSDPCRVEPGPAYRVLTDAPIAKAPEWLLAWLRIGESRAEGFAPTAIDDTHKYWDSRIAKAIDACQTMPPSQADGQAGIRLFNVCIKLVRVLELPLDKAHELVVEHFNPRCTDTSGNAYPWNDDEIQHKLTDARDKSDIPCGLHEGIADKMRLHAKPRGLRDLATNTAPRQALSATHVYKYKASELAPNPSADRVSFNELKAHFAKHPDWIGVWQFDDFKKELRAVNPPLRLDVESTGLSPGDTADLRAYLEFMGILASDKDVEQSVTVAARGSRFHPVREYLDALPVGDPSIFNGLAGRSSATHARSRHACSRNS